jgi:putative inorganic carbon (HCO3(-)) transporter
LIGVIFGTTFFICLYGVIQLFGFDFIKWEVNPSESYRIFSSLGQPNFLASWLLLVLPLISLFFFYCFNFWRKEKKSILFPFFAFLMFLFVFFVLIFTQSRGAWL